MQNSAKGLISFFCYIYMLPLLRKKIGPGKVRHLEKMVVHVGAILTEILQFRLKVPIEMSIFGY